MSAAEIVPSESSDDDLVMFEQPATQVFENVRGQIVIRQTAQVFEDDPFVIFNRENLPALISALSAYVSDVKRAPAEAGSHRNAAAARQKRYRERHRNDITRENRDVTNVTPDAPTERGRIL